MGKKSKSKTPREMQDNTAAEEEEKPSSLAKKLLNHWLRFSSGTLGDPELLVYIPLHPSKKRLTERLVESITENRSVLHVALHAPRDAVIQSDGKNVVPDVWEVLDKIQKFSQSIRSGFWVGATGKALKDVIAVGISGSFLGPLQTDAEELFNEHKNQFSPI